MIEMDNIGIVDIYGNIIDKSEIVLCVGSYNNIHGILTYYNDGNLLQMRPIINIAVPSIIRVTLRYETPLNNVDKKLYFSLKVNNENINGTKYININIDIDGNKKIAYACLSSEKTLFWIDYSSIDNIPRSKILSGVLYSLKTTFGEQDYIVNWNIEGFLNGDLVILLPTTWYENIIDKSTCKQETGIFNLIQKLNQISFKGYTSNEWCENVPYIIHCDEKNRCGNCLGQCNDYSHICYPNINNTIMNNEKFICGPQSKENNPDKSLNVSFSQSSPSTTGNTATWVAIAAVILIIGILVWGLNKKNN